MTLQAQWVACSDVCVPESGEFTLAIPADPPSTAHERRFAEALVRPPREPASVQARATIERSALAIEVDGPPRGSHGRDWRFIAELAGRALGEAMAGQAVSRANTHAYGCSVKYPSGA